MEMRSAQLCPLTRGSELFTSPETNRSPSLINDILIDFFSQFETMPICLVGNHEEKARDDAYEQTKSLVREYNWKKIIHRLRGRKSRTVDYLKAMIQWNNSEKDRSIQELRSNRSAYTQQPSITEKYHLMKDNRTEEEYVDFLLNVVKRFLIGYDQLMKNQQNSSDAQSQQTINYALALYQSRLFHHMLNHYDLTKVDAISYFEKVTAHHRSIDLILKCLLGRKQDLGEIYSSIVWQIVPTVERKQNLTITPQDAFESIFNDLCHSMNNTDSNSLSLISSKSFYDEHCNTLQDLDENPSQLVHLHAEILLIDYLLENRINATIEANEVEIGISKLPCFPCSIYIDLLNKKHQRCFHLPNCSHGKIYPKWSLRQSEDPAIVQSIDEKLVDKVKEWITRTWLDSKRTGAKRSGDSDIMSTSLEEEEFDKKNCLKIQLALDLPPVTDC